MNLVQWQYDRTMFCEGLIQAHFGSFWLILAHLAHFGSFGSFWLILANFGSFWLILAHFGSFWPIFAGDENDNAGDQDGDRGDSKLDRPGFLALVSRDGFRMVLFTDNYRVSAHAVNSQHVALAHMPPALPSMTAEPRALAQAAETAQSY